MSYRPMKGDGMSAAVIYRAIAKAKKTLILDEFDATLKGAEESVEGIRQVLNSGHERSGEIWRCTGTDFDATPFPCFAPCAIGLIGRLPETLQDRSIQTRLERKSPSEKVEKLRERSLKHIRAEIPRKCARWAQDHCADVAKAEPAEIGLTSDRQEDNWEILLAIAEVAGGSWPDRARSAACVLSGEEERGDDSTGIQLLVDVREIFDKIKTDRIFSSQLCQTLASNEVRQWAKCNRGQPITEYQLARLLKEFRISPRSIRIGEESRKGYKLAWFEEVFARYLPSKGVTPSQTHQDARLKPKNADSDKGDKNSSVTDGKLPPGPLKPRQKASCDVVTDRRRGVGHA
jgi:putative DNA primase/helicase